MKSALIIFFGLSLTAQMVGAQNGSIDSMFGSNGIAATSFFGNTDVATSILIQKDNKVLTGGYTYSPSGYEFAVARYNPNGLIDSTFGINGKTTISFGNGNAFCNSMALQADGKVVLAGYIYSLFTDDFAMARILPNGQVDYSFGISGRITKDFARGNDRIQSVIIHSNGKILAIGSSSVDIETRYALAQFDSYGFPDTTFGVKGLVTTDFGGEHLSYATSVAIQNNEKIVVGGYSYNSQSEKDFSIARYNLNGSIDTVFGASGKVLLDFGYHDNASSLCVQPDGKIIIAGNSGSNSGGNNYVLMAKLINVGLFDTSFGTNGKLMHTVEYPITVNGLVLSKNGSLNITGFVVRNQQLDIMLFRYQNNGLLDSSFGNNGRIIDDWGGNFDKSNAVALQSDGKIIIGGVRYYPATFYTSRYINVDIFKVSHWTGASDNNWHNPENWSSGIVPDSYTDVIINSPQECIISNPAVCRTIRIFPNSNVDVRNKLTVYQ